MTNAAFCSEVDDAILFLTTYLFGLQTSGTGGHYASSPTSGWNYGAITLIMEAKECIRPLRAALYDQRHLADKQSLTFNVVQLIGAGHQAIRFTRVPEREGRSDLHIP